jgi:NADH dehydrogenase FAD-containing subunit
MKKRITIIGSGFSALAASSYLRAKNMTRLKKTNQLEVDETN